MNHQKEDVLQAAEGLWPDIVLALTNIDPKFFNGRNQPCQICGGKDRARFIRKHDMQFHCNVCGDKSGLAFYMELTGVDFSTAINDVGDYLNLIPVERREQAKREHKIVTSFPSYYEFDMKEYDMIKQKAEIGISPWQRVSGLNFLDILRHGDYALLPLLDRSGQACDFVMVDVDGNWQTTAGNKTVPSGFYSVFGDEVGKRTYIAVNAYHAAHASVFMQRQVVCCYEVENIESVANNFDGEVMVVVSGMDDVEQADICRFSQLTFNAQNKTVGRTVYAPFEIVDRKKQSAAPSQ